MVRLHYLFLTPWIVFSFPLRVFAGLEVPISLVLAALGLSGTFAKRLALTTLASVGLLVLLIAGKIGTDLINAPNPDTALFLTQFLGVLFFMEATRVVLSFDLETHRLEGRPDELSREVRGRVSLWTKGQLATQAKLMAAAFGISLVLLVFGSISSVSINQLAFLGVLVLLVIGVLLFLLTQRREPESSTIGVR